MNFFSPFPDKKSVRFRPHFLPVSGSSVHIPSPPIRGVILSMNFFSPFPDKKSVRFRPHFLPVSGSSVHIPSPPIGGVILSIHFLNLFPTKKSVAFRPYLLVHILQYTARGCQSLVPCFSLISWSCTRILFFLSTTALGCAFNVLLHACTVAPNVVTAFIILCHRSHVRPFTRPKSDFFV